MDIVRIRRDFGSALRFRSYHGLLLTTRESNKKGDLICLLSLL